MTWTPRVGDDVVVMPYRTPVARATLNDGQVVELTNDVAVVRFVMGGMTSMREFDITSCHDDSYSTPHSQWATGYTMMRADDERIASFAKAKDDLRAWDDFVARVLEARRLAERNPKAALDLAESSLADVRRTVCP